MTIAEKILDYAKECEEKSEIYARRAELRAAAGESAIAQSFGDWAFIYSVVALRLRQIVRVNQKDKGVKDGMA